MSRTVRRTKEKKRNKSGSSHFINYYVTDSFLPEGVTHWGGGKKVLLTGKEYSQGYYYFHGDTSRNHCWGNHKVSRVYSHRKWDTTMKEEVLRFMKDPDYEIIVYKLPCIAWDRV